ncbi:hypothetical protein [Salipiger abyssi]|uniref:Uncharacterized protein n=1 Tax=Salipiger abyssi TaxID=1250539 RepID=A0A1P8UWE1_9RHOB|nr:hypothetical protein [Salipiger abyssi]APZ53709.1 hypothetical protein Ga0080574_TMP3375 [Salipiger abyssi]
MTGYFIEQRRLDSWSPAVISGNAPATVAKNGKIYLRRSEGLGARIRETPREILTEDVGKPLAELATIYGADGAETFQPKTASEGASALPRIAPTDETQSTDTRTWNDYHDRHDHSRWAFAVIAVLALCGAAVMWFAVNDWFPALIKAMGWEG